MKSILRDKANFDVLEGFLSTLLKQEIKVISLLESESNQQYEQDKFNRVDLAVVDARDELFLIEIQYKGVYFFKNSEIREDFRAKNIQRAREKLDVLNMSEAERRAYEQYLIDRAVQDDVLQAAHAEGERNKALTIARTMQQQGFAPALIAQLTGVTEAEIEELASA